MEAALVRMILQQTLADCGPEQHRVEIDTEKGTL